MATTRITQEQLDILSEFFEETEGKPVDLIPRYSFSPRYSLLVEETFSEIWVEKEGYDIVFASQGQFIKMTFEADCCSNTWVTDFFGFSNLVDSPILAIDEISLETSSKTDFLAPLHETQQEEDSLYGLRFRTAKGAAVLSFRNSSNGYYGGGVGMITTIDKFSPAEYVQIFPSIAGFWVA